MQSALIPLPAAASLDAARYAHLAKMKVANGRLVVDVANYKDLAHWVASQFVGRRPRLVRDEDDVHSEAMLGLMAAARRFDAERGYTFTTYASTSIYRWLQRAFDRTQQPIRLRPPSPVASLDRANDHAGTLHDLVPDRDGDGFVEAVDRLDAQRHVLEPLLRRLHPREKEIIRLRYWQDLTLQETAEVLGVTRERVRQLELRALRRMGMTFVSKPKKAVPTERQERLQPASPRKLHRDRKAAATELIRSIGPARYADALPRLREAGLEIDAQSYANYRREVFPDVELPLEPVRLYKPSEKTPPRPPAPAPTVVAEPATTSPPPHSC